MSKTSTDTVRQTSGWEPKYPFDLVVTYEDTETRNQAMQLYDHLAQNLLDDYDFQCTWWRFDLFRNSSLCEQAADAAAEANMIILCLRSGSHLPAAAKTWINTWLPRRDDRKSALVSLVGNVPWNQRNLCPANLYLRKVAHVGRMDFFSHAYELDSPAQSELVQPLPNHRLTTLSPIYYGHFLERDHIPRWGINE